MMNALDFNNLIIIIIS